MGKIFAYLIHRYKLILSYSIILFQFAKYAATHAVDHLPCTRKKEAVIEIDI